MGYLSLLQGIFPTQGSHSDLPHGRQILYHLSHMGGVQCNPCQNSNGICNNNKNLKFTQNHRRPQIPKSTFKEKNKAGDTTSSDKHYTKKQRQRKHKQLGRQTKKCLQSKGNNRVKRQPTKWEKIFANHMSSKRLILNIGTPGIPWWLSGKECRLPLQETQA